MISTSSRERIANTKGSAAGNGSPMNPSCSSYQRIVALMSATGKHAASEKSSAIFFSVFFAAFRPVEHHPQRQVARKVFEAMHDAGGGEEHITATKSLARFATNKFTAARGDDVD